MAEGDALDLEALVAQRIKRPSYARTISWEFQRTDSNSPLCNKRRRRKSKKQSQTEESVPEISSSLNNTDDNICHGAEGEKGDDELEENISAIVLNSDSEEVYYSAEEIVLSDETDTSGEMSQETSSFTSVSDKLDCDDIQELPPFRSQDIDDEEEIIHKNDEKVIKVLQERYRAPSKKQKRKKRRAHCVIHSCEILPFCDAEIMPDIISDPSLADDTQAMVTKAVPSLVELCLASWRQHSRAVSIPHGILSAVKDSNYVQSFKKFQISWLQKLLSTFSTKDIVESRLGWQLTKKSGEEYLYFAIAGRNIYNKSFYADPKACYGPPEYEYGESSSFLRFTYANTNCVFNNDRSLGELGVKIYRVFGVLATLIDLMMPSVMSDRNGSKKTSESESEKFSKAMETVVIRVKGALRLRFKGLVDMFFNDIIPYVFWARGDIQHATSLFLQQIASETSCIKKALYTSEIGRMYAQHEDPEMACKYYRAATDLGMQSDAKFSNETNSQMVMLLANTYDQGMMKPYKLTKSTDMWQFVVTSPHVFKEGAVSMVVDSLLCFHSGPKSDGTLSSFEIAKSRLERMIDSCPEYLYHISMLQALEGKESTAETTYKDFLMRANKDGMDAPGLALGRRHRIWGPLCAMVAKSGPPVPLHVLWRVQLHPLVVKSGNIYEADLCSRHLNLRLNCDGYITGDMQTLLPPRRGINLDPYTGAITNVHTPGRTEPWQTIEFYKNFWDQDEYLCAFIPTPLEVYSDEDGIRVQLMRPESRVSTNEYEYKIPGMLTLYWCNAEGESLKVNLMKILEDFIYKKIKQKILKMSIEEKKTARWERKMLKILDSLYVKRKGMTFSHVNEEMTRLQLKKQYEEEIARGKRKFSSEDKKHYPYVPYENDDVREYEMKKDYPCYGKTLVLQLSDNLSVEFKDLKVFFDCSTRKSFATPTIVKIEKDYSFHPNPNQKYHNNMIRNRIPEANIIYFPVKENKKIWLKVYGHCGKFLYQQVLDKDREGLADEFSPFVMGDCLVSTTKQKQLWCLRDSEVSLPEQFVNVRDVQVLHGQVLLIKFDKHFSFVHVPSMEVIKIDDCSQEKRYDCEDGKVMTEPSKVKILAFKHYSEVDHHHIKIMLALDTVLMTLLLPSEQDENTKIRIIKTMEFSGFPTEVCFVGDHNGYLVAWTHCTSEAKYREFVSYFDSASRLVGVLPCLGPGPRSFFPLRLPGDANIQASHPGFGAAGWHVYMRDGHEGILGIKLTDF